MLLAFEQVLLKYVVLNFRKNVEKLEGVYGKRI